MAWQWAGLVVMELAHSDGVREFPLDARHFFAMISRILFGAFVRHFELVVGGVNE
jgi:hypothetical protein